MPLRLPIVALSGERPWAVAAHPPLYPHPLLVLLAMQTIPLVNQSLLIPTSKHGNA